MQSFLNLRHRYAQRQEGKAFQVIGAHSSWALALWAQQRAELAPEKPLVIVTATEDEAEKLFAEISTLLPPRASLSEANAPDSQVAKPHKEGVKPPLITHLASEVKLTRIPAFDVSPYSGLYPNPRSVGQRVRGLYALLNASSQSLFIASAESLAQKTLPAEVLIENTFDLAAKDELPPQFKEKLIGLGYMNAPLVEDLGQFAIRGGIVDIFSPAHEYPMRLELFGDEIEALHFFDPETQRRIEDDTNTLTVLPVKETLYSDENRQPLVQKILQSAQQRKVPLSQIEDFQRSIVQKNYFHGVDFFLPYFYRHLEVPLDYLTQEVDVWVFKSLNVNQHQDAWLSESHRAFERSQELPLCISPQEYYSPFEIETLPKNFHPLVFESVHLQSSAEITAAQEEEGPPDSQNKNYYDYKASPLIEFEQRCQSFQKDFSALTKMLSEQFTQWKNLGYSIIINTSTHQQLDKVQLLLSRINFEPTVWNSTLSFHKISNSQNENPIQVHLSEHSTAENLIFREDKLIFIDSHTFWGQAKKTPKYKTHGTLSSRAPLLQFNDLNPGDLVVHKTHGVAIYEGLKIVPVGGVDSEFIQLSFKDSDKLYLPVYRIHLLQKFSGPQNKHLLDKLGGTAWTKTKARVRKQLRDMAAQLLKTYAHRAQATRSPFQNIDDNYVQFENTFPYDETEDQLSAISDVFSDMSKEKPMDRLICGDVGFGKTEVALRASFRAIMSGKQVAIIAPTTILTFQHFETFKKRFKNWPVKIAALNRFVSPAETKKNLAGLKEGHIDIVIGTHRLLSKDVEFKNLGLLIIDEEQKFGVKHKERLRALKGAVDCLAMSATPIPRTLNLSLVGIRDLSLINTAPVDRLPTRTFVCRFDKQTIKSAIESELQRGGQVFFLHNRVQTIDLLASELRELIPQARFAVGHGQMDEHQLEKTILAFFNKEVDVLICTTIIESGMDIPNANTMFIDNAHQLGLSQLYQLRGAYQIDHEDRLQFGRVELLNQFQIKLYNSLGAI